MKPIPSKEEMVINQNDMADPLNENIKSHTEIRDVLLLGGDSFTLSTERLEHIIRELRKIPHVDIIRIGTRTPVVMPMRIDDELQGFISGFAVPKFVIDAPGGGGKVPFSYQYMVSHDSEKIVFENYKGDIYS